MLAQQAINSGDNAWLLVCAGLVMFMVPGLAIFYAGLARTGNTLVMMQQNFISLGVVSVAWILLGYTIAFGDDAGSGLLGNLELFGLRGLEVPPAPALHVVGDAVTVATLSFVAFQMMFAVITPALVTGATAGRLKFAGWVVFLLIWSLIVYSPVVHWIWHPGGWLAKLGAQDWAGGIVVHTSAGAAVLGILLVVGRRRDWPRTAALPSSVPLAVLGGGILWFGWFGFNGGDGLQANGIAAQAVLNTHIAAAAGMLGWLLLERLRDGHATVIGGVSGAVAGLATVTPCAGYVSTLAALAIGVIAGLLCHTALRLKYLLRMDDALDVLAVHFVGGMTGSLLLGFFADADVNPRSADGLFNGGGAGLLGRQVIAVASVAVFSFLLTWVISAAIQATIGLRAPEQDQGRQDKAQQGLDAYHLDAVSGLPGPGSPHPRTSPAAGRHSADRAPAAPAPGIPDRLVTGMVDPDLVETGELRAALLGAGAASVVLTEAFVATGGTARQHVRGYHHEPDLVTRLRVEVLAPDTAVASIFDVLDRFSQGRAGGFVLQVRADGQTPAGPAARG